MLDRLVEAVCAGQSRALVLCGDAGVGKTALLEHLVRGAADCQVVQIAGVESEMELAFAGLHQLCAPLIDGLDDLPAPQADALRIVFGISAGPAPDRFLVGLATLSYGATESLTHYLKSFLAEFDLTLSNCGFKDIAAPRAGGVEPALTAGR